MIFLLATKTQNCVIINQKGFIIVVCEDGNRETVKGTLLKLRLKTQSTEYGLWVVNFGEWNEGRPPVWITQLGILDTADDLGLAFSHAFLKRPVKALPKFKLYRMKVGSICRPRG
jgi:hypothetical protein